MSTSQITVWQWFRLPRAERERRVTEFRAAVAGLEIIRDATGGAMVPAGSATGLALDDLAGRVNDLWPAVPWWCRRSTPEPHAIPGTAGDATTGRK